MFEVEFDSDIPFVNLCLYKINGIERNFSQFDHKQSQFLAARHAVHLIDDTAHALAGLDNLENLHSDFISRQIRIVEHELDILGEALRDHQRIVDFVSDVGG